MSLPPEHDQSEAPKGSPSTSDETERHELLFKIWAKAIDTQMHFNEMSTRSRQLGLTFIVSALALAAVMVGKGDDWSAEVHGFVVHGSVLIVLASAGALHFVRQLDLRVYHRMLRGSVTFNESFEEAYFRPEVLPKLAKGMTEAVSHFSRCDDAKRTGATYTGVALLTAEKKIERFYFWTTVVLVGTAIGLLIITNLAARPAAPPPPPEEGCAHCVLTCPEASERGATNGAKLEGDSAAIVPSIVPIPRAGQTAVDPAKPGAATTTPEHRPASERKPVTPDKEELRRH